MITQTDSLAGRPVTLKEIEDNCAHLARVRARAQRLMDAVERKRAAVLADHAAEIRDLAEELVASRGNLELAVQYGRQFFLKPKSQIFHGIEVGFEKERDTLQVPEDEVLIPRIETLLKAKAAGLIRNVKSIVREAFKQLTTAEKQMLGCRVVRGADKVIVRAEVKSDVEKFFAACAGDAVKR